MDRDTVTYSIKCDGQAEMRVSGLMGLGLVYIALGIAARQSFLTQLPIVVLENGVPLRIVTVNQP